MDCCAHEGPGGGDARFDIKKVADGVYAAVASPAYKVNCNTAIIGNADGVMVVDTHSKPSAAMLKKGLKRIQDHVRQLPGEIAKLKADIQAASPAQRGKLEADLRLAESYLGEVRALKPALPTIAFEKTM